MSTICNNCQQDYHFNCDSYCQCQCSIEDLVAPSRHDNVLFRTENARHSTPYREADVRQRNRRLQAELQDRRHYDDVTYGKAPLGYRFRKWFRRFWITRTVFFYARRWLWVNDLSDDVSGRR